jgi:hypothetical protein
MGREGVVKSCANIASRIRHVFTRNSAIQYFHSWHTHSKCVLQLTQIFLRSQLPEEKLLMFGFSFCLYSPKKSALYLVEVWWTHETETFTPKELYIVVLKHNVKCKGLHKQNFLSCKKHKIKTKYHERNKQRFPEIFHHKVLWNAA